MKFMNKVKTVLILGCILLAATSGFGQTGVSLHIGDNAPELRFSKWIKGTPLKWFDTNRLYAVEFWATWCIPCKQAMPHLSELARKYRSNLTIIGVNAGEMTGGKPYATILPKVEKFVEEMGGDLDYDILADNNENYMWQNWLTASGQSTIPTTFLIQKGKIIWIGHPNDLEKTMLSAMEGNYDMMAQKKSFDNITQKAVEERNKMTALLDPINKLIKDKKYTAAIALIDSTKTDNQAIIPSLQGLKFSTLLNHVGEKEALAFAEKWTKEYSSAPYMVGKEISEKQGLSKQTYEYAAKIFEQKRNAPRALKPMMDYLLAACYQKAGKVNEAVAIQQEALDGAKAALAAGKWPGAITVASVKDYEDTLDSYKKLLK